MEYRRKRYRIKNRFRFITFASIVMVIILLITSSVFGMDRVVSLSASEYAEVRVQPGDTLWDIARRYGPDDIDTRRMVYEICRCNDISANSIHPGQVLLIPEYF